MTVSTDCDARAALLDEVLAGIDGPLRTGRERLVDELLERGYDVEALREAHRQDRLVVLLLDEAFHETAFLTARDVAEACGVPVDDVLHVSRLLGVPVDDANTPAYDEHSCEAIGTLTLARAYGISESAIEQMVLVLGRHISARRRPEVLPATSWVGRRHEYTGMLRYVAVFRAERGAARGCGITTLREQMRHLRHRRRGGVRIATRGRRRGGRACRRGRVHELGERRRGELKRSAPGHRRSRGRSFLGSDS
jgi:hypothetical protein